MVAKLCLVLISLVLLGLFFSFRILDVPSGLTIDEAAFGYNAILLSQTLHDQNGRFLPVFVLSIDGKDWRQPITQYYLTAIYKIFGPSVLGLRLSSVAIVLISASLLFLLARQLFNTKLAMASSLLFLTTPLVMIQSHLGLDNIMPVPFTIAWLLSLLLYTKTGQLKFAALAGLSLGISFYTYKGMRATVPIWAILTIIYLAWDYLINRTKPHLQRALSASLIFGLAMAPFMLIIPWLDSKYPGAIFDHQTPTVDSVYSFLYPYLSSYDPSFLFIRGDETIFHSTFRHGMMLLATLPLFVIGLSRIRGQGRFWWLVLIAFLSAPLLYGLVNSVHRASRLMTLIPSYVLISTLAIQWLSERFKPHLKLLATIMLILGAINYFDFLNYYWFTYPQVSKYAFGDLQIYRDYQILAEQSRLSGKTPYISRETASPENEANRFFERIYFPEHLNLYEYGQIPPSEPFLLMAQRDQVPEAHRLGVALPHYYLYTNPD